MNAIERKRLSKEAEMQINALKKIRLWKALAIAFSTLGVALTYLGIKSISHIIFVGIFGIIFIILGTGSAMILNLGLRNGEKNVKKILYVLDSKKACDGQGDRDEV